MKQIHSLSTFRAIHHNLVAENKHTSQNNRYTRHRIYQNYEEVVSKSNQYEMMSGVLLYEKHISLFVLLETKDVILAHEVVLENNRIFYKMNLPFWQLTIATRPTYMLDIYIHTNVTVPTNHNII